MNNRILSKDLVNEGFVLIKKCGRYKIFVSSRIAIEKCIFRYTQIGHIESILKNCTFNFSGRKNMTDQRELGYQSLSEIIHTFNLRGGRHLNTQNNRLDDTKGMELSQHISCWTTDDNGGVETENYLMWKAYKLDDGTNACRIQTSIQKFIDSINHLPCDLFIGEVTYKDINAFNADSFRNRLFRKANFYRNEQEIRFLLLSNRGDEYLKIGIDSSFIDKIVLSPFASEKQRKSQKEDLYTRYPNIKDKILDPLVREFRER